jgi:hypothetical protein
MSDFEYSNNQSDYNYLQASQKCMRCRGYLLGWDEIVSDPLYRDCVSHANCVEWEKKLSDNNITDDSDDVVRKHDLDESTQSSPCNLSKKNASQSENTQTHTDRVE